MQEYRPVKEGKVREIYDVGEGLIMVATDRISAFDVILKNRITDKGAVLTQLSRFWFEYTKDVMPNHMISTDTADMPEYFRTPEFERRSMLCKKLTMLPIECIVRGYITGSGWESYKKNGTVCGIQLPAGLQESEQLPEPIFTPAAKAELGDHDENVSFERVAQMVGLEPAQALRQTTLELYTRAADIAKQRGIILADTKFEFGRGSQGELVLGDEVLTPDSSRFWPADQWVEGQVTPSYDKQFVRDWLAKESGWDRNSGQQPPALPEQVVERTRERYLEAYERLTGKPLAL